MASSDEEVESRSRRSGNSRRRKISSSSSGSDESVGARRFRNRTTAGSNPVNYSVRSIYPRGRASSADSDDSPIVRSSRKKNKRLLSPSSESSDDEILTHRSSRRRRNMVSSSSEDSDDSCFSKPSKKKCKVLPETESESSLSSDSDSDGYIGITSRQRKKQTISSGHDSFSEGETSKKPAMVVEANSSDDDGDKCIICFKTLRPPFAHPSNCEHNFHPVCLSTWSKTSNTCPIDRVKYTAVVVVDQSGGLVSRENVKTPPPQNHNADFELDDATFCEVCSQHDREHELLLCDRCEAGYHLNCLDPPLLSIPEGNWFCPHCAEIHVELSEEMQSLLDDAAVMLAPRFRSRAPVTPRTPRGPRTRGAQRVFNIIHHQETISQPSTSTSSVTIQRRRTTSRRSSGRSRGSRRPRSARYKVELITVEDGTTLEVKVAVNTRSRTKSKKHSKKSSKKKCSKTSRKSENSSRGYDQSGCSTQGPSQSLDLFGSRPQLDYFSGCEAEDELDEDGGGGGLAMLRRAARPNVRSMTSRKQIAAQILNSSQRRAAPRIEVSRAPVDLVSSIIEQQEKWHNPHATYHTTGSGQINVTLKDNSRIRQTAGGSRGSTGSRGNTPSASSSSAGASSSSRTTPPAEPSAGASGTSGDGFHPLQPPPEPPFKLYEDDDFDLYADIEPPNPSKLAPPPEPPAALFALDGDEKEVAGGGGSSSPEDSGLVIDDRHDTYDPEMPTSPPMSPGPNDQDSDVKARENEDPKSRILEPPPFLNRLPPPPSPPELPDDESECPNQGMYSKISMEIAKGNENSDDEEILPPPPPPPFGTLDLRTTGQRRRELVPEQEVPENLSISKVNNSNDVEFDLASIPQPLDIPVPEEIPVPEPISKSPAPDSGQDEPGKSAEDDAHQDSAEEVESTIAEKPMDNAVVDKLSEAEDQGESEEEETVAEQDKPSLPILDEPAKIVRSKTKDKELSEGELDEDDDADEQIGDGRQGGQNLLNSSVSAESNDDQGHMDEDEPRENGVAMRSSDDGVASDGEAKVEKVDSSLNGSQGSLSPREDKAGHYKLSSVVKKVNSSGSNEGDDMLELGCEEERDGLVDITDEEISNYEKSWEMEDNKKREKGAGLEGLETEAISDCEYPPAESDPVEAEKQEDHADAVSAEEGAIENGNKEEEGEITNEEKVPVQWKKLQKDKLKDRSYRGDKDMKNKEKKKEIIKKKEKRKELERYNVRKLISEKPRRKVDEFGRDISSHSDTSSPSLSPVSRGRRSTSRSKKRRSRTPSRSKERLKERGRSRERVRERSGGRAAERSQDRSKEKPPRRERSKERKSRSRSKKRGRRSRSPRKERNRSREKSSRERKKRKRSPSLSCSSCSCSSCEREKRRSKKLTVIVPNESVVTERSRDKPKSKYREKQRGSSPKRRKRSSPVPSKEVFTSGDNILVSVNFKSSKSGESTRKKDPSQSARRKKDDDSRKKKDKGSKENQPVRSVVADKKSNRRKLNTKNIKPIAIIDLDASPFRETILSPKEVIILTDSDSEDKMAQDGEMQTIPAMTGPKTPPEPHIKFNIINNKQQQLRQMSNPLLELSMEQEDEDDEGDEDENEEVSGGHKGPNTPPEPPVPYDPFEPTKSRSPTPGPEAATDRRSPADGRGEDEPAQTSHTPPPKQQHEAPKTPSPLHSPPAPKVSDGGGDGGNLMQGDKAAKAPIFPPTATVTVDSGDDSPGGGGGGGDSPYSPGSSEGDDLFEPPLPLPAAVPSVPPPAKSKPRLPPLPIVGTQNSKHLLPLPKISSSSSKKRMSKSHKESSKKGSGKKEIGIKLDEDQLKILDELPNSAVEMQVKDKFLKKLNRQERVVEEVKMVLKPHYAKKHVTKEEYKEILRKAVPKICHSRSGEINPIKIQRLIEAYVKKYRHKSAKKKPAAGGGPSGIAPLRQNKTKTLWC